MDKRVITLFGLTEETAITVLVDAIIYTYESIPCTEPSLLYRSASIEEYLPVVQACPESEEERNFLFYMFGIMNSNSFWTGVYIVLSLLDNRTNTRAQQEQAIRMLIDELIFSSH